MRFLLNAHLERACEHARPRSLLSEGGVVGSVIKKRRKRMAKKKHRKLLKRTRIQRRNKK
jgi:Mitochondrial mRNA-processing protein COX24, C-terminal